MFLSFFFSWFVIEVLTSQNFGSYVTGVAFHPTKNLVASCSADKSVKLWNADSGAELWTVKVDNSVNSIAYSPDGSKLAAAHSKTVSIFNVETNEVQCTVSGHSYYVRSVAWSPDGTKLASGSDDKTVRIWEAATGKQLWQLTGHRYFLFPDFFRFFFLSVFQSDL